MFTEFSVHGCLALFLLCFGIRYNILEEMCSRIYLFITWDPGEEIWGEKKKNREKKGEIKGRLGRQKDKMGLERSKGKEGQGEKRETETQRGLIGAQDKI